MKRVDRIIISVNDNPDYTVWAKIVPYAWRKLFPGIKVCLCLVHSIDDNLFVRMVKHFDDVFRLPIIKNISVESQAAVARYYYAATCGKDVCMVNDIDLIPMQTDYYMRKLQQCTDNQLLVIGRGCYKDKDKFPIGYLTAKGQVWGDIVNPTRVAWHKWVKLFCGWKPIDTREDIARPFGKHGFNDESWLRALVKKWGNRTCEQPMDFKIHVDSVTRICKAFPKNPVEAHHLMPVVKYRKRIERVCTYIGIDCPEEMFA